MSRRDVVRKYSLFWGYPPTRDFRPFHAGIGLGLLHFFLFILFETSISCLAVFLTCRKNFNIPLGWEPWYRQNSHLVLLYFMIQPLWLLLSFLPIVLCMDRKKKSMNEWMHEWTENLKTRYIFKRSKFNR